MTPAGKAQLASDEGCRLTAYQDEGGVWTIGVGQTGSGIGPGVVWSQTQADVAFAASIASTESRLTVALPWFSATDSVRADVLTNIAFNVGVSGLQHWPNTLALFEAKDWPGASNALLHEGKWNRDVGERANRLAAATLSGAWG